MLQSFAGGASPPPTSGVIANLVITTAMEPARLIIDGGIIDVHVPGTLAVLTLLWVHQDPWKTRVISQLQSPAPFYWDRAPLALSVGELGDVGFGLASLVAEFRYHDGTVARQLLDGHIIAFDFESVMDTFALAPDTYDDPVYTDFAGLLRGFVALHHRRFASTNQFQELGLCRNFDALRARLDPAKRPAGTDVVAFVLKLVENCAGPVPSRRPVPRSTHYETARANASFYQN